MFSSAICVADADADADSDAGEQIFPMLNPVHQENPSLT